MAKLELTLIDDNGQKKYYQEDHVSGQKLLDYWNLHAELDDDAGTLKLSEVLTRRVEFVAGLFSDSAVTPESFLNGVDAWELMDTLDRIELSLIGADSSDPKKEQSQLDLPEIDS